MITPGEDYYIIGNISDPPDPVTEVNIRTTDGNQVQIGAMPPPSGQGNYYIFTANNGTAAGSWTFAVLQNSNYLQPVSSPGNPNVEDAETLAGSYNLYVTPVSDNSPDVFYITTGTNATGEFLTLETMSAGSDVFFKAKSTPDSSKQKWKFSKTTHLVKPLKEVPEKKGLFGFLKKKK